MKKLSLFCTTFLVALGLMVPVITLTAGAADLVHDAQCTAAATDCVPATPDPAATGNCTDETCDIIAKYVNPFIKFLGILVGIAVTVGIIWGGIEYSSSGGDPQKASRGKRHITVAVTALLAYFFIYAAIRFLIPTGASG